MKIAAQGALAVRTSAYRIGLKGNDMNDEVGDSSQLEFDDASVFTVDEAARLCRVNRKTIMNAINAGTLHGVRLGRAIRISRTALRRFIGEV